MNHYFHTNEKLEATNAVSFLREQLEKVAADPYYWKWVLIVLHNALQSFMVCTLRSTHGFHTMRPKTANKCLASFGKDTTFLHDDLDFFLAL